MDSFQDNRKKKFKCYILDKCKLVSITLTSEDEVFQLFDSQNSRGKTLEAYDLLKAYHLREISTYIHDTEKKAIVRKWEEVANTEELKNLFNVLYRVKIWTKKESGFYFDKSSLALFKGINKDNKYHYPYVNSYSYSDFNISNPVFNGESFFYMIEHYVKLYKELFTNNYNVHTKYKGSDRTGDRYIKNLFEAAVFAFADRFGVSNLDRYWKKIYIYAYHIRIKNVRVFQCTIINNTKDYFCYLNNSYEPNGLNISNAFNLDIEQIINSQKQKNKYKDYEELEDKLLKK